MRLILLPFILLLINSGCNVFKNEQSQEEVIPCIEVFTIVEEPPVLIGGIAGVQDHIRYPEMAIRHGIEGRVIIEFDVNTQGFPIDLYVARGIGGGADEEALRIVSGYARFQPGKQKGIPVCVEYSIPITFILPD